MIDFSKKYPLPDSFYRPDGSVRFAFMTFVMRNDSFVPGALVFAHALRRQRTLASLVCMVTRDVTPAACSALGELYDRVVQVDEIFIAHQRRQERQDRPYLFTRFQALRAGQAARVGELCDKASSRGVAPIVVQTARQVLMACDMVADATITLTVSEDGQPKEEKVNLFNAVAKLLSVVPGRIGDKPELTYTPTGERPESQPTGKTKADVLYTQGKEDMTPEEAEQLARERRKELGRVQVEAPEV